MAIYAASQDVLLFSVVYHIKVNVFSFWTDKTRHFTIRPWTFSTILGHFIDQTIIQQFILCPRVVRIHLQILHNEMSASHF